MQNASRENWRTMKKVHGGKSHEELRHSTSSLSSLLKLLNLSCKNLEGLKQEIDKDISVAMHIDVTETKTQADITANMKWCWEIFDHINVQKLFLYATGKSQGFLIWFNAGIPLIVHRTRQCIEIRFRLISIIEIYFFCMQPYLTCSVILSTQLCMKGIGYCLQCLIHLNWYENLNISQQGTTL